MLRVSKMMKWFIYIYIYMDDDDDDDDNLGSPISALVSKEVTKDMS